MASRLCLRFIDALDVVEGTEEDLVARHITDFDGVFLFLNALPPFRALRVSCWRLAVFFCVLNGQHDPTERIC